VVGVKIILNVGAVFIKDLLGLGIFTQAHELREFLQIILHPLEILWWDVRDIVICRRLGLNLLIVLRKHSNRLLSNQSSSLEGADAATAVQESSSAHPCHYFS